MRVERRENALMKENQALLCEEGSFSSVHFDILVVVTMIFQNGKRCSIRKVLGILRNDWNVGNSIRFNEIRFGLIPDINN